MRLKDGRRREIRDGHVGIVREQEDGHFVLVTNRGRVRTRSVVIAAGIGAFSPRRLPQQCAGAWYGRGIFDNVVDPEQYRGQKIGRRLIELARERTVAGGVHLLRVDCWSGGDRRLVSYYISEGFTPTQEIEVQGKGELEPKVQCEQAMPREQLIDCLAPNRRVEIKVVPLR